MSKKFLTNIDLGGNQLLSARVHNNTTQPTTFGKGQLWYDSTNNQLKVYNGSTYDTLGISASGAVTSVNTFSGAIVLAGTANHISASSTSGSVIFDVDPTVVFTASTQTLTNKTIAAGSNTISGLTNTNLNGAAGITNANILNPNTTLGTSSVALGGTLTTIAGLTLSAPTLSGTTTNSGTINGGSVTAAYLSTSGDLQVGGNLYFGGSVTYVSASTAVLQDPLIYLADNNPANLWDIGIIGSFTPGASTTYQHTGLLRDHNVTNTWRLVSNIPEPANASANFASATYDALALGGLTVYSSSTNISASITGAGFVTAPSANFTSALQLGGSAVATQNFVTSQGYVTSSGSVAGANNSASLGGVAASGYAQLASANFTTASVGGLAISKKQAFTITGDNATASFVVAHSLNTQDLIAQLYQTSAGPDTQYAEVMADIVRTSAASVTVSFATAPANTTTYNLVLIG